MRATLNFSLPSYLKFEFWWNLVEFVLLTGSLWLYVFHAELFSNFHAWYRKIFNCVTIIYAI